MMPPMGPPGPNFAKRGGLMGSPAAAFGQRRGGGKSFINGGRTNKQGQLNRGGAARGNQRQRGRGGQPKRGGAGGKRQQFDNNEFE